MSSLPVSVRAGRGLTSAEAERRQALAPARRRARTSRSYADIVRTNTLTVFNLILGVLLAVILALGDYRDALFGGVLVANTLIGIVQEVRAKRKLDRLALLVAPQARAWRDGELVSVPVEGLVVGDLVRLEPGDQVVADGRLVEARGLSLDESILTGESDQVERGVGEEVRSGSYCVAGSGEYEVEAVGAESFAERLAAEAQGTRTPLSPLQLDVNRLLWMTVWAMLPLSAALVAALVVRQEGLASGARTAVAAMVPLVPEGLVLLTSITFAVAAVRLARLGTLAQRLNAVESLASVDTVCLDKTGTLTDNRLAVTGLEPLDGRAEADLRADLGLLAASVGTLNATMQAIRVAAPGTAGDVLAEVPFSSARKWSGLTLVGRGSLVLGAPDVLERLGVPVGAGVRAHVAQLAGERRRVVLLCGGPAPLRDEALPPGLSPLGLVVLSEGLRQDARDTVDFLREQGVAIKIISGDAVATVQAVAAAAGVPGAERALAGADLPADPAELAHAAEGAAVFGRITPEQKRELVRALTRAGRYVAMVGDGVNDVLALKEARLAVAMGNGSQMAKGVADLVLLTNAFATVPVAVREGRSILRNFHRVAKLFLAKTAYAALLLATLGIAPIAFPFLPRHLTVVSSLTIGLPAFVLALAHSPGRVAREGFLAGVVAFSVRAGAASAAAIAGAYLTARGALGAGVTEGRSIAVIVATLVGLAILLEVERGPERRRIRRWVWAMAAGLVALFTGGLAIAPLRGFFAVVVPGAGGWALIAGFTALGAALLIALRRVPALARHEARGLAM